MQWVDMRKYSDSLKRDGGAFDSSDERITTALSRPGLYIVRFNKIDDNGTHVIKLGRTDITDDAKLINRMRDYHGANAFSHSVVAFGLTRRRKFDSEKTRNAQLAAITNYAEGDMSAFVKEQFARTGGRYGWCLVRPCPLAASGWRWLESEPARTTPTGQGVHQGGQRRLAGGAAGARKRWMEADSLLCYIMTVKMGGRTILYCTVQY